MGKKFYNDGNSEISWGIDYWKDYLILHELSEIKLHEQKRDIGSGHMWCTAEYFLVDSGSGDCGKNVCKFYEPRNGKNGRCFYLDNTLIDTGKIFILNKDGLKSLTGGEG